MNHDDEIAALREHFERRGLDTAESLSIVSMFTGINIGLASADEQDVQTRLGYVAGWIQEPALRIVRSLRGQSGERLQ